jgi:hypothetical protein
MDVEVVGARERVEVGWQRMLLWVWLTSSAVGVGIWHVRRLVNAPVSEWLTEHIITLSYFTNLTNTLIVVMAARCCRAGAARPLVLAGAGAGGVLALHPVRRARVLVRARRPGGGRVLVAVDP